MNFKDDVRKYDLDAPDSFRMASNEEILKVYNGAGPDWMPEWGRDILTDFLEIFKAPIAIHDWRFQFTDKIRKGFKLANKEFLVNMRKIIKAEFSIWSFDYWRWQWRAFAAYRACVRFGWSAYINTVFIALGFGALLLTGCRQTVVYEKKEYYEPKTAEEKKGPVKSEEKVTRSGSLPWSDNKNFSFSVNGVNF